MEETSMKKMQQLIAYSLTAILFVAVGFVLATVFLPQNIVNAIGEDVSPQVGENFSLSEQELVYENIYNTVAPSVVSITIQARPDSNSAWAPISSGSGFVIDEQGHIVTNYHVIAPSENVEQALGEGAEGRISISMFDGTITRAEIIGRAPQSDLAVIRVDVSSDRLFPVTFGDSEALREGQFVFAIGNPFSNDWTLTSGIVSALNRSIPGLDIFNIGGVIQTDAAINPGNSGGPLVNLAGQVVGVNSQINSETRSNSGVAFAIPSNLVVKVAPILIRDGEIQHSYLGISSRPVDLSLIEDYNLPNNIQGVPVNAVQRNGPAGEAGLLSIDADSVDIITAINDVPIADFNEMIAYLSIHTNPSDVAVLTVYRDGEIVEISVTLGERPN
jgi:S1-C subfamily serine protease